jgi:hypothetical protein
VAEKKQCEHTAAEFISTEFISAESVPLTFVRVLSSPYLRTTGLRCIASILRNFFFLQSRAAFLPGLIPVSKVDHPLDSKIPFLPTKVNIYLDFVAFWIRTMGFLLRHCGRKALEPVRNFMETMGGLYALAAEVYRKNLSTTERPFYIRSPRFLIIHSLDPHLMCIPSLHVMVVIRTYTRFAEILKLIGEEERFAQNVEELRRGALAITEAVLYIKQHSVNCIPAAMYAMTKFDSSLFPPEEAERFASDIFIDAEKPDKAETLEIRERIVSLYRRFLAHSQAPQCNSPKYNSTDWTEPLLAFLKEHPQK